MTGFAKRVLDVGKRGLAAAFLGGAVGISLLIAPSDASAFDCSSPDPAQWPAPAKPYFMIGFDTSGSMATAIASPNSCGYPNDRLGHGRCAVKNTIQAFSGLANFGLASYARVQNNCAAGCFTNCTYANLSGNASGSACTNGCGPEPGANADSSTRGGANILVPMRIDSDPPSMDNTAELVSWVDNNCTGSKELFADGCTPMNGMLRDMFRYYSNQWVPPSPVPGGAAKVSPLRSVAQGERPCRSVNVIFVTDGAETCDTLANAVDAAADLFDGFSKDGITWKVKTFVIDFGDAGNEADQIAFAGGTGVAKHATNEEELAIALADIISKSVAPEVCDNVDNNCNNCVDEGFKHYCNQGQTCCSWATAAQRTTCLNNYTATITPGNPGGDLTKLPCTTPAEANDSKTWLCYDPKEICDNTDNNCQSGVDEGFNKCGNPLHCPLPNELCNNAEDDNCNGIVNEGCPCPNPQPEVCDGCDNDCNGIADDGIAPIACGFAPPANCSGQITCKAPVAVPVGTCVAGGGFNTCNNSPQAETCDGVDNDCDGLVDDGIAATACEPAGTPPGLVYGAPSQCVLGSKPCNGTCSGWVGPSVEICDGIDNDCDGVVDDGVVGAGQLCGNNTPPCSPGTTACVAGALVCQGGVQPKPETCNGVDDNCNGAADDAPLSDAPPAGANGCWNNPGNCCTQNGLSWCPPPGATCADNGSLTAPCNKGTITCNGAAGWTCQNAKAPTSETCDNIDNNCNGLVDDGNLPGANQACGTDTGECVAGITQCVNGVIDCVGDVGPVAETCNTKDDDCDGQTDESIPGTGVPCGNNTPPCQAGVVACVGGAIICQGGVAPQPESCDNIDNNCNGQIDEGQLSDAPPAGMNGCWNLPGNCCSHDGFTWCPPAGATCTGNGGLSAPCGQGALACASGAWTCQNAKPPTPEVCDGIDNNCNGAADDVPAVACDPPGAPPGTVYGGSSQCKKGTMTCGACVGAVGPGQEVCDGIDNDCDGVVDDSAVGAGVACGNATPPCVAGTTACVGGALVCQGGTGPQPESCDGIDNNCNGAIDDGNLSDAPPAGQNGCWNLAGNCCTHDDFSWCPPPGATCTGNGALLAPCAKGTLACSGGAWTCQGSKPPGAEVCDATDNNCDGQLDNVTPVECEPVGAPPGTVYGGTSQCKKGQKTCGACAGAVGPSPEVCDGVDNDCDGAVDESIVGVGTPCGVNQPPCTPGTTACVAGAIMCQGGVGPKAETCDGIDNDCDGQPDDAPLSDAPAAGQNGCWNLPGNCCSFGGHSWCPPPGATCNDNGGILAPCHKGVLACAGGGGWVCQNAKPPAPEACDGLDNDCNGAVDDGSFPQEGQVCGTDTGECVPGVIDCQAGTLDCVGDVGPVKEVCDGLDNDCDTQIDNGVSDGGPCEVPYDKVAYPGPRDKGACKPGVLICNGVGGYVCIGGVGPSPEVCDVIDNDCDGKTDEMGPQPDGINGSANPNDPTKVVGQPCGTDVGVCEPGQYACLNGFITCVGGAGATPEECDCKDNNCDGSTDNPPAGGQICSPGKDCVKSSLGACSCSKICGAGENPCPPGFVCDNATNSETGMSVGAYCVPDPTILCGPNKCLDVEVKDANGNVTCAPAGTPPGANCIAPPVCSCIPQLGCKNPCYGVTCDGGKTCSDYGPNAGTCVLNNCYNFPCLGCGKDCHNGSCLDTPCQPGSCPDDQVCKPKPDWSGFDCVPSCASVSCPMGQVCNDGACVPTCDPACAAGQVCDTTQSPPTCINDQCNPNPCVNGAYCDPLNGNCGDYPCAGVDCPDKQKCEAGQCVPDMGMGGAGGGGGAGGSMSSSVSASASSGTGGTGGGGEGGAGGRPDRGVWGLPTGGGGCDCSVGPGAGEAAGGSLAALLLALATARRRGRQKAKRGEAGREVGR